MEAVERRRGCRGGDGGAGRGACRRVAVSLAVMVAAGAGWLVGLRLTALARGEPCDCGGSGGGYGCAWIWIPPEAATVYPAGEGDEHWSESGGCVRSDCPRQDGPDVLEFARLRLTNGLPDYSFVEAFDARGVSPRGLCNASVIRTLRQHTTGRLLHVRACSSCRHNCQISVTAFPAGQLCAEVVQGSAQARIAAGMQLVGSPVIGRGGGLIARAAGGCSSGSSPSGGRLEWTFVVVGGSVPVERVSEGPTSAPIRLLPGEAGGRFGGTTTWTDYGALGSITLHFFGEIDVRVATAPDIACGWATAEIPTRASWDLQIDAVCAGDWSSRCTFRCYDRRFSLEGFEAWPPEACDFGSVCRPLSYPNWH